MIRQRLSRRPVLAVAALVAAVVLAGCGGTALEDITPEASDHVMVEDSRFTARVIEVAPGTEVTWTWDGRRDHNVVGDGFQSELQTSGTFTHTFTEPGWYRYICTLHGGMTGAVSVTE